MTMNTAECTVIKNKERNSSFELLRLILMFLIIIHHGIVHGLKLTELHQGTDAILMHPDDMLLGCLVNCLCIPAVNVFVLISGYFGIKLNRNKFFKLLIATALYTFVFTSLGNVILGRYHDAISSLQFITYTNYWFIRDYLFLMCFAPLLNMFSEQSSKHNFSLFLIAILFITCYFGFMRSTGEGGNGYNLFQFVLMYCIGRYVKRFNLSLNKVKSSVLYLGSTLLCGIGMYVFYRMGKGNYAWHMTHYNNPLLIIAAISLVLLFKNFQFSSKVINKLALSSIAIYLVQSSLVGRGLYHIIKYAYTHYEIGGVLYC